MASDANKIISSQFLFHLNEMIFISCLSFCFICLGGGVTLFDSGSGFDATFVSVCVCVCAQLRFPLCSILSISVRGEHRGAFTSFNLLCE